MSGETNETEKDGERIEPSLKPAPESRTNAALEKAAGPSATDVPSEPKRTETPVAGMILTAVASACVSIAATVTYFHFFPPRTNPEHPPVMVADMLQVSQAVAEMSGGDMKEVDRLFETGAETMRRLREAGVLVIDAKSVISAPGTALLRPSDLIPGAPDVAPKENPPVIPDLFDGKNPTETIESLERGERIERSAR